MKSFIFFCPFPSVLPSQVTDGIRQELSDAIMKQTQAAREVASLKAAAQQATREREQVGAWVIPLFLTSRTDFVLRFTGISE